MVHPNIARRQLSLVRNVSGGQPNLNYGEIKEACRFKPRQFKEKFGLTEITTNDGKKMWFKDNGSKVLFVAHLDTILPYYELSVAKLREDTLIYCPTLDDRLGVYIGLYWLPKAGIKPDILLTTDEEKLKSTGHYFNPPKQYNWMFMFDRRGDGAVTYQYNNEQLRYKLGKHGFTTHIGTYSCIKDMSHLGCCGINFGTGYELNHTHYAYASRKTLESQLRKFRDFWKEFYNTSMPWKDPYKVPHSQSAYERYASSVDKHADAFKKQAPVKPSEDNDDYGALKRKVQSAAAGVITKATQEELPAAEPLVPIERNYRDVKTFVMVNKEGKVNGYMTTRRIYKLYWPTEVLPIDSTLRLILRTQWKVFTLYDLCKLSPYMLVSSKFITAKDADRIVEAMFEAGFDMPYNVQGLMTPDQYAKQRANGWKKREQIIKPVPVEKRLMDVAKKKQILEDEVANFEKKLKENGKKAIELYPLPDVDLTNIVAKSRMLIKDGYPVKIYAQCKKCEDIFTWDVIRLDKPPVNCPRCQEQDQNNLSLFPAIMPEEGGEILTKIVLKKDRNDRTEFRYLGKDAGEGIERFGWVDKPSEKRIPVGLSNAS